MEVNVSRTEATTYARGGQKNGYTSGIFCAEELHTLLTLPEPTINGLLSLAFIISMNNRPRRSGTIS